MPQSKKNILLIHPLGFNWMPNHSDMSRIANIMPPIGLCSIAAYLEKHGHKTTIYDCYAFPMQDKNILETIKEKKPDCIGFSTTTSSFPDGVRIAKIIKETYPNIKIIFGGVHISALKEKLLKEYSQIDFGIIGEGEESFLNLIDNDFDNFQNISSLIYRNNGKVEINPANNNMMDIDSFPFPAYEKLFGYPEKYKLPIFNYPQKPNTTAVTSRGCPYQCAYCDRSVFGRTYRFNSAEYVFEMMKYLKNKFGIRHINFYDDVFTLNQKRTEELCRLLINAKLGMSFNCATRAECINPENLKTLKKAGCWMISLGIESGDVGLLKKLRTNADLDLIKQKVREIKNAGIRAKGLFMLGLPGESEESINKTINFALSLPLDDLNVSKFVPFPGTPLYTDIEKYGSFNENWELMNCLNFVFIPNDFSLERLEERYKEFYRRHYQRTRILFSYVKMIWQSPDSWIRFLYNLKDFMKIRKEYKK